MKRPSMQRNTLVGVGLVGALAGIGGSIVTGLLAISIVWATVLLLAKRIPAKYQRSDLLIICPAYFFALAMCASAILGWASDQSAATLVKHFAPLLAFLFFPLLLARLRTVEQRKLFDAFLLGCSLCGILALPAAIVQVGVYGIRAEGGAGNAIPFAMISCLFGSLSLLNLLHAAKWRQKVGLVGFLTATLCLLLSETRGLLPIPFIASALFLGMFPKQRDRLRSRKAQAFLVGAVAVLVGVGFYYVTRLSRLFDAAFGQDPKFTDESASLRLQMWEHAIRLISERPLFGHGLQNRRALISELDLSYSHFHNGFLTAFVDSGLIGFSAVVLLVAAPLLCAVYNPLKLYNKERLFIALMVTLTYAIGGMTNFIFLHDIYDSVFLWSALIVAAPLEEKEGHVTEHMLDTHLE